MKKRSISIILTVLLVGVLSFSSLAGGPSAEPTEQDQVNVSVGLRGKELSVNVTDNYVGLFGLTTENTLKEKDATAVIGRSNYTAFSVDVSVKDTKTPEGVAEEDFLSHLYLRVNPQGGGSYTDSDAGFGIAYNTEFLEWRSSDFEGSKDVASITQRGHISFGLDFKYKVPEGAKPGNRSTKYQFIAIPKS